MEQDTRIRGRGFRAALLILTAVNLMVIAAVLGWLWKSLAAYERNSPVSAMEAYFAHMQGGGMDKIAKELNPGGLNTAEDTAAWLRQTYTGNAVDYRYAPLPDTKEGPRYAVYHGDKRLGTVTLRSSDGESGPWSVRAELAEGHTYTIQTPAYVQVMLGGQPLPDSCRGETSTPVDAFAGLRNQAAIPQMVEYTAADLIQPPVFTAKAPDGRACRVTVDEEKRRVTVTVPAQGDEKAAFETRIETVAKLYARYISQDAELAELAAHVDKNSDFYDAVRAYDGKWYNKHTGYAFEKFAVTGVENCDANSFVGDVSFDYVVSRSHDSHTYPTKYRLAFQKRGNDYQLVNLLIR